MLFVPVIHRSTFARAALASQPCHAGVAPSTKPEETAPDQPYTLVFDVPGVTREQLSIGIEGNIVRLETLPDAPRSYRAAYELPQDIDVAASEAKLENGVLTLKLTQLKPESKAIKLTIN